MAAAVEDCLTDPARYEAMSETAIATARSYSFENWRDTIGGYLREAWGSCQPVMPDLSHLRISFVAGTLAQGGSERQLYYMARSLARAGATTQVLCLTQGEFWQDKIEAAGVAGPVGRPEPVQLARLVAIVKEVRRFRPSVLQSQHFYTNPYVLVAARWLGIPEVGAIRSATIGRWLAIAAFLRKFSLLRLRHIAANSQQSIDEAIELGVPRERLTLLPNVIDLGLFHPLAAPPAGPIELLSVGRLGPEKRHDIFFKVLARARALSAYPITGRIVGSGNLREPLEKQAAGLGLTSVGADFFRVRGRHARRVSEGGHARAELRSRGQPQRGAGGHGVRLAGGGHAGGRRAGSDRT